MNDSKNNSDNDRSTPTLSRVAIIRDELLEHKFDARLSLTTLARKIKIGRSTLINFLDGREVRPVTVGRIVVYLDRYDRYDDAERYEQYDDDMYDEGDDLEYDDEEDDDFGPEEEYVIDEREI